ncbi:MAG: hypothetical protein K9M07_00960 [Simkaniaceae bacterium]|nr:hypothetical protein [Simkaniaceae bacterium]
MKWTSFFKQNNFCVFLFVLTIHIALPFALIFFYRPPLKVPERKKIVVTTKVLPPQPIIYSPLPAQTQMISIQPKKKKHPTRKARAKQRSKKSPSRASMDQLFAKIEALQTPQAQKESPTITIQPEEMTLHAPQNQNPLGEQLLDLLYRLIELPKKGKVQVQFTIMDSGALSQIKILESDEDENARYILKLLNSLCLPKSLCEELSLNPPMTVTLYGID